MANTKIPVELSSTPGIVDNSNATAITIDSSENVGIGNTVASSMDAGGNNLVVGTGSGTEGMTIYSGTANSGVIYFADGASGDDRFRGQIGYSHSDNAFSFRTNAAASANMVLDSSGNVGITAAASIRFNGAGDNTHSVGYDSVIDGSFMRGQSGMRFLTGTGTGSERMRIDSSGNVGIGGAPVSAEGVFLQTGNNTISQRGFSTNIYYDGSNYRAINTGGSTLIQGGDNHIFYTAASASAGAIQSVVERMRIDSSGNLLVGTTSIGNASTNAKVCADSEFLSRGSAAGFFWENRSGMTIASQSGWGGWYSTGTASHFLYSDGANRASIGRTSGTYTALSDVNKKKDFEDSTVGLAEVMQLKPKKFRMLEDADDAPKKLGFIAQDVENVIPEAYVEDTNEDASGVENTFIGLTDRPIIAALTKAIQEQQTQIEALQSEINELKNS